MRVGLVAEGPSEGLVLEALVAEYYPDSEVRLIQPDQTLARHLGGGWKGVRAWCRENSERLELIMQGIEGDELDMLVIHADCSMARQVQADRPCPPASDTADALRTVIFDDWLNLGAIPDYLVLMTPAQMTDTWFVVAGEHITSQLRPIECAIGVENRLVGLGIYSRRSSGEARKPRIEVEALADQVAKNWPNVRRTCAEARRFWHEFQAAAT